jgi:exodeoxyribonuclease VII large subunit
LLLEKSAERVSTHLARLAGQSPALTLERTAERLSTLSLRMDHALVRRLDLACESVRLASGTLHAVSPLATLARGYSITRKLPERSLVKSSSEIQAEDRLELSFAAGVALCRVEATFPRG